MQASDHSTVVSSGSRGSLWAGEVGGVFDVVGVVPTILAECEWDCVFDAVWGNALSCSLSL